MYSQTEIGFERPPTKLSIIVEGIEGKYGDSAIIKGRYGPTILRTREKTNFFINIFIPFDFIHILGLVISLIAIFLTYDNIVGEKESGTLALLFSNPIERYKVILGEYIASSFSILSPLFISFLILTIVFILHPDLGLDLNLLVRILTIFVISFLLAFSFVSLGLFISSLTNRSNISLMSSFFVWSVLIIYPNLTSWVIYYAKPVESMYALGSNDILSKFSIAGVVEGNQQMNLKQVEINLNKRFEQADLKNKLDLFSPFSCYILVSQIIAGNDLHSHKRFINQLKKLELSFINWQKEKIKKYPERERSFVWGMGPIDLEGLPSNEFKEENLAESLERAIPYIMYILALDIILFYLTYIFFIKYDVRFS
jgi:ABC-type transport system involved in multi-copper enzyme maturation permease subunit